MTDVPSPGVMPPVLRIELADVRVSFGNRVALDDARMTIEGGRIHFVAGDNGSGKSTLLRLLAGTLAPDAEIEGSLRINGKEVLPFYNREVAYAHGIHLVPQDPAVVRELTVLDNVFLGHEIRRGIFRVDRVKERRHCDVLLRELEWDLDLHSPAGDASLAERQQIAVLRVLTAPRAPHLLLLDEPTVHLRRELASTLFDGLRRLREKGAGIVLVSHVPGDFLRERTADVVSIMQMGRVTNELSYDGGRSPEALVAAVFRLPHTGQGDYAVGQAADAGIRAKVNIAAITHWPDRRVDAMVGFEAHGGHLTAVYVEPGDAADDIFALLSGSLRDASVEGDGYIGTLKLSDVTASALRDCGVGLVPERKVDHGLIRDLTVHENMLLTSRSGWWIWNATADRAVDRALQPMRLGSDRAAEALSTLSGGQQQRVLLAREFSTGTSLLILQAPFQGVDIGTKAELRRHLVSLLKEGRAILVIFTDSDEFENSGTAETDRVRVNAAHAAAPFEGASLAVDKAPNSNSTL